MGLEVMLAHLAQAPKIAWLVPKASPSRCKQCREPVWPCVLAESFNSVTLTWQGRHCAPWADRGPALAGKVHL